MVLSVLLRGLQFQAATLTGVACILVLYPSSINFEDLKKK